MNGYSSLGFQNIGPAQWSWIRASLRLAQSRLCSTTPQPLSKTPHPVSHAPPPPLLVPRWCSNRAPFTNHPPPPAIHHPTTQTSSLKKSFKSLPGPTDTQLRNLSGSGFLRSVFAFRVHDPRFEGSGFTTLRNRVPECLG